MHILLLSDNYVPEIAAPSFRCRDHAHYWQAAGHEVTVVTGVPNWPHGKVFPGYRNRWYQEETIDGVRVIRLKTYMAANQGFLWRSLDYLSFLLVAVMFCWRYPRFDCLLATSPQFFTAVAGWLIAAIRRRPWVFEVRDLWPEGIRAVGVSNSRLLDALEWLELFLYRRAQRVVVVTKSFRENLIRRGIDAAKIDVVTNGVDLPRFDSAAECMSGFDARRSLGFAAGDFVIGYIGTTGIAHGLEHLLAAAEAYREHSTIRFLIMGEGAMRSELERHAREQGLTNVVFANRVPQAEIAAYYRALDLAVVHLRPAAVFQGTIPSKIFEYMASATPILMAGEGEAARIIERSGGGVHVPPGNTEQLVEAIRELHSSGAALATMARSGRRFVEEHYLRKDKALDVLYSLEAARRNWQCHTHMPPIGVEKPSRPEAAKRSGIAA